MIQLEFVRIASIMLPIHGYTYKLQIANAMLFRGQLERWLEWTRGATDVACPDSALELGQFKVVVARCIG